MKKLSFNFGLALLLLTPALSLAESATSTSFNFKLDSRPEGGNLVTFVQSITDWLLLLVGALAVLFIVLGGVQLITSAGNVKQVETAKKTLTYAIIGLIVVLLSKIILAMITGSILPTIFGSGTVGV